MRKSQTTPSGRKREKSGRTHDPLILSGLLEAVFPTWLALAALVDVKEKTRSAFFMHFFALFHFSSWCLYNRPELVAGENANCLWENSPVMQCLSVPTIQMSTQISWRSDCSQGCLQIQGTFFDSWKESITGYIYLFSEFQDMWHKPLSI